MLVHRSKVQRSEISINEPNKSLNKIVIMLLNLRKPDKQSVHWKTLILVKYLLAGSTKMGEGKRWAFPLSPPQGGGKVRSEVTEIEGKQA